MAINNFERAFARLKPFCLGWDTEEGIINGKIAELSQRIVADARVAHHEKIPIELLSMHFEPAIYTLIRPVNTNRQ